MARRATSYLAEADGLFVTDLVLAELVYVLESFYELSRPEIAVRARAVIGFDSVIVADELMLLRALDIYEHHRLHFAEAYLVAGAERSGVGVVASFDRSIDRIPEVQRIEP